MIGIRRDRYGFRCYVKVRDLQREKRFKPGTPYETMKAWRDDMRVQLRKRAPLRPASGSLDADILRYLALVQAMPTREERTRHLRLWSEALDGTLSRSQITEEQIRAVLAAWRTTLAAATVNKRRTALMHLYSVLDGKGAPNPVKATPKYRPPDPLPRGQDYRTLARAIGRMPRSKSRVRLLVMLTTGMRPAELQRAEPEDVNLRHRYVVVRTAKGGRTRSVPLTLAGVRAWREFEALEAWGRFTSAPLNRMIKAACSMTDLRVYDLRHSFGTALARQGERLDVIADLLGHSTLELTKRYTLAAVPQGARQAIRRLGRLKAG